MKKKSALIAGATGLVGSELLQILLNSEVYEKIYALVRTPMTLKHPKLIEVVCDFEDMEKVKDSFAVDDVFCLLGTTIKKAKSREVMYQIDVNYPLKMATLAKEQGAIQFLLVSSFQANANSKFWYSRIKGELEAKVKEIPYKGLFIFQPSLLLGNRKEFRLFEKMGISIVRGLSHVVSDKTRSQMGIEAKTVAYAMFSAAQNEQSGIHTYTPWEIEKMNPTKE